MLDSCLTSSFNSEEAAEELQLHGQALNLTIAGTGRPEIRTRSGRVERTVTNLKHMFLSPLQAHVVDNIAGDTLAIHCLELNEKGPTFAMCHLIMKQDATERTLRRRVCGTN